MNKVTIVTDSMSGIGREEAQSLGIYVLPMPFYIEDECYYEGISLSREAFFEAQESGKDVTTSQPAPTAVMEIWDRALENSETLVYIPMTSGLSGSCATAMTLACDEAYEGRVFVVDNGRIATPMHQCILDACGMAEAGKSAQEIKDILESERENCLVYLALDTLEYLKKGGRISNSAALVGGLLKIKPITKIELGLLEPYKKCRGFSKAKADMIAAMKEAVEGRFKEAYDSGNLYIMASGSSDEEATKAWIAQIEEAFPGMDIRYDPLGLSICCHTGPGTLGIGCVKKINY